jgi:hypothetical protein
MNPTIPPPGADKATDDRFFTVVYRVPQKHAAEFATECCASKYWSAASWSHALDDRDLARAAVATGAPVRPEPKLVLVLPDYDTRRIVIASDEVIDGERLVCVAIEDAAAGAPMDETYMLKREIHNLKRHIEDYCPAGAPAPISGATTDDQKQEAPSIRDSCDYEDFHEDLLRLSEPGLNRKQAKIIRSSIIKTIDARVRAFAAPAGAVVAGDACTYPHCTCIGGGVFKPCVRAGAVVARPDLAKLTRYEPDPDYEDMRLDLHHGDYVRFADAEALFAPQAPDQKGPQ